MRESLVVPLWTGKCKASIASQDNYEILVFGKKMALCMGFTADPRGFNCMPVPCHDDYPEGKEWLR